MGIELALLPPIAYLLSGVLFGCAFVGCIVDRVDPAARGASLGFRILILPGAILLWPLLISRCRGMNRGKPA